MREETEQCQKPCLLRNDNAFRYISMPVNGGNKIPDSPEDVVLSYINMVDDTMGCIVDTIMSADTNVLYFCNAGKDRTGVVTAIILSKLGYSKEYIIKAAPHKDRLTDLWHICPSYFSASCTQIP